MSVAETIALIMLIIAVVNLKITIDDKK